MLIVRGAFLGAARSPRHAYPRAGSGSPNQDVPLWMCHSGRVIDPPGGGPDAELDSHGDASTMTGARIAKPSQA